MVNSDNVEDTSGENPLSEATSIAINDHIKIEEIDDDGEVQKVILTKRG